MFLHKHKSSILDFWGGYEYASAAKQGKCGVCKINSRCRYVKYKSMWFVFWNNSMILRFRSSHQRCFVRKGVLRNLESFTVKHLCQSLFFNKVTRLMSATLLKKWLWHRCFSVNFAKLLGTPFLQNTSRQLLLKVPILMNQFCLTTFPSNYLKVWLANSFWLFLIGYLLPLIFKLV